MNTFAAQEAARARLLARQRQEPDEDGFITVTRGGRSGPARQEEAQEKAEKQRDKQKGLANFYRFQTRERRKAKAWELVRKFQDDRHKLKEMRERRGRFRVSGSDAYTQNGRVDFMGASANKAYSRSHSGSTVQNDPMNVWEILRITVPEEMLLSQGFLKTSSYQYGAVLVFT